MNGLDYVGMIVARTKVSGKFMGLDSNNADRSMIGQIFVLKMDIFDENILALFVSKVGWNEFTGKIDGRVREALLKSRFDGFRVLTSTSKLDRLCGYSFSRVDGRDRFGEDFN